MRGEGNGGKAQHRATADGRLRGTMKCFITDVDGNDYHKLLKKYPKLTLFDIYESDTNPYIMLINIADLDELVNLREELNESLIIEDWDNSMFIRIFDDYID